MREFITLLTDPRQPNLNVISVCQPTVPVLCAVALMAQDGEVNPPKTMVMMGGPIDARKSPTAVNNLATRKPYSWFEQNVIQRVPDKYPGYMRRVYPGFLQHLGFVAMNPDRHMNAHWDYFNHLLDGDGDSADKHREFYDEYNAVLDLPAEYYLDTIKSVFQDFALPKGRMFVREQLVRPQAIRDTALLTHRGRARRHLRQRPDRVRAPAVLQHSGARSASTTSPRAPATTASSPAGAGAKPSARRSTTSSGRTPRRAWRKHA